MRWDFKRYAITLPLLKGLAGCGTLFGDRSIVDKAEIDAVAGKWGRPSNETRG